MMSPSAQLIRVLLACAVAFSGGLLSAGAEKLSGDSASSLLLQKVIAGLPRYDENAKARAAAASKTEMDSEITHLTPMVIEGRRKSPKFDELALLTERALQAAIRQRYGSEFQYWEEKRLRETEKLQNYAANLKLAGDHLESAAIRKEIDRLLVGRNSDWKAQAIDKLFNPRHR